MSRYVFYLLLILLALPLYAGAGQPDAFPAVASSLANYYPQIKYQQINETPVAGVYEIVLENSEIIYFVPASGHMFFGELWNAKAENLTRESKDRLLSDKVGLFPLDEAIKIGNGPIQVIEVTDPDCPFCRQGSAFFAGRSDVTRYVFLYPLEQLHPHAAAKAAYILSSDDPQAAYEEVFSGMFDSEPLPEFKDNGRLAAQRSIVDRIGINGTPRYWINGQHVAGFNPQKFEELLSKNR